MVASFSCTELGTAQLQLVYRNCNVSRNYYGSVKEFSRGFSGNVRGVSKKIVRFVKEVKRNVVNINEIVVEEA